MNCTLETKNLAFYLDGILPPSEASIIESHLASCDFCQTRLAELKQVDQNLVDLGIAARLREKTLKEAKTRSIQTMLQPQKEHWFQVRPQQWAPVMATLLITIMAVFYFLHSSTGLDILMKTGTADLAYLNTGVQVTLADDSFLRVRMADRGSFVEFAPKTKAKVLGPRSIQVDEGSTWNQVAPDSAHPYTVRTPHGVVTVLGTEFEVEVGSETVVRVKKGSVQLAINKSGTQEAQIIQPGFMGSIKNQKVSAPQKNEMETIAPWRNPYIPNRELKPKNIADVLKGR